MLSSGVECVLDSSACSGTEDLHKGLPLSIPSGVMAVSEPSAGLDTKTDVSTPELAHSSELSSEHHRTLGTKDFGEHLDDVVRGVRCEPAELPAEELLQDGDVEEDEENKRTLRKQDCSIGEYHQRGEKEAQDAEEDYTECCALKPGEKWLKQEDPHLNKYEANSSTTCCTETAGSLKSKGENQANVQVTAESLPKLTEEAQGMKADGTRIFSKAGYQNGSVSKGLPPESDECPDVETVMARAGVSETTRLDFLEPLKVMDMESTTEHSQEINDYNGLKAHADMSLRTGGNAVSILETTEEKLQRQNLVNESSTSLDNCQTYQQDGEDNTCDFCTILPPRCNESVRLSSVESCRMLSIKKSEVLCSVLESVCYLDFRNASLDNNSAAIHGIINETSKKHLPESMASQTNYDHRTGFVENCTSKSMPIEHLSALRHKELSSDKTDDRETSDVTGKSCCSEFEEAAELQREIAVGGNTEADFEHCHSSVFSPIASSSEEFAKEKLKTILSEANKWKKDQLQCSVSVLCKDDVKESSLLKEKNSTASHEIGQTDVCIYKAYSKISSPGSHDCQDLSAKLEEDSPEAQLLEKESQSNTVMEFSGKGTDLMYTLNVTLPPVAQKSREPHCDKCLFCTANKVASKDKAQDNLSEKESFDSSGTTDEQVSEFVLHKDKFKSSINPKTSDESSMTSDISQKNMKSSERKVENVDTGLENERNNTWNSSNQTSKDQNTAATTSSILSRSTFADDAVLNSNFFKSDVEMKTDENDSSEVSAGYNSKKTVIFLEEHCCLACRSLPHEDGWGNRCVALFQKKDTSTEKSMFYLTYAAEESTATLVGDEISNKNMKAENMQQFDLCRLTDCSEICDKDEAKDQISMCAVHTDEFDKIRTVSSPRVPEGNWRSKAGEQLLVRYLNKKNCVHNFGFCNSPLCLKMRELSTPEEKRMSLLTASSSATFSICGTCPLLSNMNMQTRHAIQTEKTISPMENQFLARQSEFCSLVPGRKQCLESLNKESNTGSQYTTASVEEGKLSISSSQYEEVLLKKGDDLTLLDHKHVREDGFQRSVKENVVDFQSSCGLRNADYPGCTVFISDLIQEKMTKLKEKENSCGREDKETLEESLSDSKSQCSQHALSKCAEDKAELVFSGNIMQQSSEKMKCLFWDQANTVNAPFLPVSINGNLFCKPEKMHVLSEMENKSLRIKSILNNSCLQLMLEPGKETDARRDMGPSHFVKFNIQNSSNETHGDSEASPTLNLGSSLPQNEKLCVSSENTDLGNSDSSSDEICSKGSSVTKPLSVTMYVKGKACNAEIPPSEDEKATRALKGAKSSSVCACKKKRQRDEKHKVLTAEVMDVTLPKYADHGEKLNYVCIEEKMEGEVSPRKRSSVPFFLGGEDCLWTSLEGSKDSSCRTVTVSSENYEEHFEEIPRPDLNSFSKERNATKPTSFTDSGLLSESVQGCQTADASDTETSPEFKCNEMNMLSNSHKESLPNYVVQREVCVPYKLNAQSKDNAKENTGCQDTIPAHSISMERETSGSVRLDRVEKCQALKQKKKEAKVHRTDKAKQEKKAAYKVKAEVALHPSILYSSELLCSSSNELVMSRNTKFESPSEDIFVVRCSENKLCSTLQEIERPKITTDTISSCFLKTQDSEMENLKLKSGYNGILGAFGTKNKQRGPLPLKIQPGRACKKVPTSYRLETVRKMKKPKSSAFLEPPSEMPLKQENTVLKSLYFTYKSPTVKKEIAMRFVHVPGQKAKRCGLQSSLKFRKCTKEPVLLSKLSAIASKLLGPATSLETLPYASEILPVAARYSQRRSKNLLEAFSCINSNLHSRWVDSWCTKMFSFQSLALYSAGSTKIPSLDSSNNSPPSFVDTPVFPISFHVKLDSSPVTDLTWTTSQHSVNHRLVSEEMLAPPSKWTFLLSQSCSDTTVIKEDSSQDHELHSPFSVTTPGVAALHPDHRSDAIAKRTGSHSMLGLHTVLALSSPGCYRIWTRRRNLTSHIPTIQRLFISQFTQGLKGKCNVSDDLVSSLPYSLGRALSIWSQHGPSACPSEITPLHSSHCKWQPSVGIEKSYAMHLPVQSMEAVQTAGHGICLEPSFPLPLPKSCLLSEALPPRLPEPELQAHALDEADTSIPDCYRSQDDTELKKTEPEKRPKKVSQIRIRKTVPRLDHNLTPMGLPKPKRLKKKEFSLEEIYTNKNYKSPPPARSLETIFEEPKEKNGHLISVSQQKRKRILEFQDFTVPRKRKTRGKIKVVGSFTRAKKAAPQSAELDALLTQKLMDLEEFFAKVDEQELSSSTGGSHELQMVQ
ncbi:protein PRR14L [Cyrtonyx montezumae]|uniref:protein PRR14L n=1 Tax=Cyrtonyx montezumae TaxID=9017 RepID=UPI0032DB9055